VSRAAWTFEPAFVSEWREDEKARRLAAREPPEEVEDWYQNQANSDLFERWWRKTGKNLRKDPTLREKYPQLVGAIKEAMMLSAEADEESALPKGTIVGTLAFIATANAWIPYIFPESGSYLDGRWSADDICKTVEGAATLVDDFTRRAYHKGCSQKEALRILKAKRCPKVLRLGVEPSNERFVDIGAGLPVLNVNPTKVPEEATFAFPLIRRILEAQCGHDPETIEWVLNWMAWCVQNPKKAPRVALVIHGQEGSGKSITGILFGYCRGSWAEINASTLERDFNLSWADSSVVIANEVVSFDGHYKLANKLKSYITDEIELNGKFLPVRRKPNTIAWVFTSNDPHPVQITGTDRRYTVLASAYSADLEQEMKRTLGEYDGRLHDWEELRGFRNHLLNLPVDELKARTPLQSKAREAVQAISRSAVEEFHDLLLTEGLGAAEFRTLGMLGHPFAETLKRKDGRIVNSEMYSAFAAFCRARGNKQTSHKRFTPALRKLGWKEGRGTHRFWEPPEPLPIPAEEEKPQPASLAAAMKATGSDS
jgi:hypothetical protein